MENSNTNEAQGYSNRFQVLFEIKKRVLKFIILIAFLCSLSANSVLGSYYYFHTKQNDEQRRIIESMNKINDWQQNIIKKLNDDLSKANQSIADANNQKTAPPTTTSTSTKKTTGTNINSAQETVLTPPAPPSD